MKCIDSLNTRNVLCYADISELILPLIYNFQPWYFCNRWLWWLCECVGWTQQKEVVSGKIYTSTGSFICSFNFQIFNYSCLHWTCSMPNTLLAFLQYHSVKMADYWLLHLVTLLTREKNRENNIYFIPFIMSFSYL